MPGPLSATSPTAAPTTFAAPTPSSTAGTAPRTATPKPHRPPPVRIPSTANTPHGGTPRPTPTSAVSQQHLIPNPGTPSEKRGKKRDHDEVTKVVQQQQQSRNPNQNGVGTPKPVLNGSAMPRAIKKQRMVRRRASLFFTCLLLTSRARRCRIWQGRRGTYPCSNSRRLRGCNAHICLSTFF